MRILVVSPHLPYPGVPHAGGAFLLDHLRALGADHDVTLLVPVTPSDRSALPRVPEGLDLVAAEPDHQARPDAAQQRDRLRRRARFRSLQAPALRALRSAGLHELAQAADVVELHWMDCAILLPELRAKGCRTPVSLVAHDVDAESASSRQQALGSGRARFVGAALRPLHRRTMRHDLDLSDLVLVFKEDDRALLRDLGVSTLSQVLAPNIVLPGEAPPPVAARTVVFVGALWRPENEHGVRWFLDHVWPRVRVAESGAEFRLVGAGASASLRSAVAARPGASLIGEVEDLAPHYTSAAAFVAPLFVAGGLKFKVVQAMAYGRPVVASTVAACGLPAELLWAVADDPAEMAGALLRLLRSPGASSEVGAAAAAWCREHMSFERSTAELVATYQRLVT